VSEPTSTVGPRVAFVTLGCPKNEVDSDRMQAIVSASDYELADQPAEADVVVVNTCSFIEAATEESIATILDLADTGVRVVVAGCMPSRYGADLAEAMPEAAALVPVADESRLLEVLDEITGHRSSRPHAYPTRHAAGPAAYLQISDGCHRRCSYCTIPFIRGPYRSRSLESIVEEASSLVALGARELILIGQDISAWGRDLDGPEVLADVVDAVASVDGVDRLRLMYVQPDGVTDRLLEVMAAHANVCRYLDMPLQHASRSVLKAMRRSGDAETYLALIAQIRSALPGAVLRTTFIAGFPGETRADAAELLRFVETARFDYVGVFPYSREDGTEAATMEAQVPRRTALARAQRLRDACDRIGAEINAELVDRRVAVLVEGYDAEEQAIFGRTCGQAPDIDGIVYLDAGEPGEIVEALIVDACGYELTGKVER